MPVSVNASDLTRLVRQLGSVARNTPREFAQTIASVGRASKTETKRASAAVYNAPQSRIDQGLKVRTTTDSVLIEGKRKTLTLKSFKPRQTKKGVLVTVIKSRGRKRIKGGFSPTKFNGVPFIRLGSKRFPIAPIQGPSVADMLNNKDVFTPLQERLVLRARNELDRRITRALKNRG